MDEVELLLSDEFVQYSDKMKGLHAKKKAKQDELKATFEKIKSELAAIDDEAKAETTKFNKWKAEKLSPPMVAPAKGK